jgi:hypothetical protein
MKVTTRLRGLPSPGVINPPMSALFALNDALADTARRLDTFHTLLLGIILHGAGWAVH